MIISEKLATLLDVSEGDDIYLEVSSLNYKPVKVMHIAENYYYHYATSHYLGKILSMMKYLS